MQEAKRGYVDLRRRRDERKPRKPAGTLLSYSGWLLKKRSPESTGPKTGGDKLLLMTILEPAAASRPWRPH